MKAQADLFTQSLDPNVRHLGHLLSLAVMASEVRDLHLPDLLAQLPDGYFLGRAMTSSVWWVIGVLDKHGLGVLQPVASGATPEQALVAFIASRKDTT